MGGFANPTGVALIIILTLMVVCSLSFVRRSGYFQIFYFSHLGYWLYWGLLVLHAPTFWQWILLWAIILLSEKLYRVIGWLMGRGKTLIDEGVSLPSRSVFSTTIGPGPTSLDSHCSRALEICYATASNLMP